MGVGALRGAALFMAATLATPAGMGRAEPALGAVGGRPGPRPLLLVTAVVAGAVK